MKEEDDFDLRLTKNREEIEPFLVPDGYFLSLPENISEKRRTIRPFSINSIHSNWYFTKRPIWVPLLMAAMLLIALIIILPARNEPDAMASTIDTTNLKAAFDASYAEETFTSEYAEIDQKLRDPVTAIHETFFVVPFNDTIVTEESIIDYLKDQDLDTDLLAQL